MRKQLLAVVGVVALGLAGNLAWAEKVVATDIPFSFIVSGKEMPAGNYVFRVNDSPVTGLVIQSKGGSGIITAAIVTRLAQREVAEPTFYFDRTEDGKHYLSEFHLPGMDGFAFQGAPGKHTHEAVIGNK